MKRFTKVLEDTPRGRASSVRQGFPAVRLDKAKEQAGMKAVPKKEVICHINDFLKGIGMKEVAEPEVKVSEINFTKIKGINKLSRLEDIVIIKMTEDGYIGGVTTGVQLDFTTPTTNEFQEGYYNSGAYTTNNLIIHYLKKDWNRNTVLLFPLPKMPEDLNRSLIRRGIGNYLIHKGVPVLDYWVHNYSVIGITNQ